MESARPATSADLDTISAIAEAQRAAIVDQRGGALFLVNEAGAWPHHDRLHALLDAPDRGLVIAGTYDDVVFGYAVMEYVELLDQTRLARLSDFVVAEEIRGSGIGEAMMNLALEHAKAADCIGIDSVALPGDRSTKNFFESFGLKARLLAVHRSLLDD
jgi:predicted N-acetyltransferase YhbS